MNEILKRDIGTRLKIARIAAGFKTSKMLANKLGISPAAISQHENGLRSLDVDTLTMYSNCLEINPGWLLTGRGPSCEGENIPKEEYILKLVTTYEAEGLLTPIPAPIITNTKYANIDTELFKNILLKILPLLKDLDLVEENEDLIEFGLDLYNRLISTNADQEARNYIIELAVESFFSGKSSERLSEVKTKIINGM